MKLFELFLFEYTKKSDIIDLYIIMSMPQLQSKANQFIVDQVVQRSRNNIVEESRNIVAAEIAKSIPLNNVQRKVAKQIKSGKFNNPFSVSADRVLQGLNQLPTEEQIEADKDLFWSLRDLTFDQLIEKTNLPWTTETIGYFFNKHTSSRHAFGGRVWGKIAEGVSQVEKSKSTSEFLKAFDRFVDLVHNTGSVLDKFEGAHEGWITFILDLKQHALNITDLIRYASRDVQKLFREQEWRMQQPERQGNVQTIEHLAAKYIKQADFDSLSEMIKTYGLRDVVNVVKRLYKSNRTIKKRLNIFKQNLQQGYYDYYNTDSGKDYKYTFFSLLKSI